MSHAVTWHVTRFDACHDDINNAYYPMSWEESCHDMARNNVYNSISIVMRWNNMTWRNEWHETRWCLPLHVDDWKMSNVKSTWKGVEWPPAIGATESPDGLMGVRRARVLGCGWDCFSPPQKTMLETHPIRWPTCPLEFWGTDLRYSVTNPHRPFIFAWLQWLHSFIFI